MKIDFKNLFTEDVQKILTEESLQAISNAFEDKVKIATEAALLEQDELYANKLQALLEAIEQDKFKKLKHVVNTIDKANTAKLVKVVNLYENTVKRDGTKFKNSLVKTISDYLDTYLEESVDSFELKQAVKNNSAYKVLDNLKKALAVESTIIDNGPIKEAILDGKKQIDTLSEENTSLKNQIQTLKEKYEKSNAKNLLESKIANFPSSKKEFLRKALGDKSFTFIKENFDYTSKLFDKQEKNKIQFLKEDAIKSRKVVPDFIRDKKVVEEKVNNNNPDNQNNLKTEYLQALSKSKGHM